MTDTGATGAPDAEAVQPVPASKSQMRRFAEEDRAIVTPGQADTLTISASTAERDELAAKLAHALDANQRWAETLGDVQQRHAEVKRERDKAREQRDGLASRLRALADTWDGVALGMDHATHAGQAEELAGRARELRLVMRMAGVKPEAAGNAEGGETAVEWAVFHGGPDPDNCAGYEVMRDQADAEEGAQWRIQSGVARRMVAYGPWEVMTGEDDGTEDVPRCIRCGCTDEQACPGGCTWVPGSMDGDLCSRCADDGEGGPYPSIVRDLLLLAGEDIPLDRITGWSAEDRAKVTEWAGREHLNASDNPVERRPRPSVLGGDDA